MRILPFKPVVFSLAVACFLASSARAESFTFTGNSTFGNDFETIYLSGPSFSIFSSPPAGDGPNFNAFCTQGAICKIPGVVVNTANLGFPGLSGGTVGGVTAYMLSGSLNFSGSKFIAGPGPTVFGSGPVTFTGRLMGFVFLPLGCETNPSTCTSVGPQVFDLRLRGTGILTVSGEVDGPGSDRIFQLDYTYSGTASTTPEPSSLLLVSSGGLSVFRRRLRRQAGK